MVLFRQKRYATNTAGSVFAYRYTEATDVNAERLEHRDTRITRVGQVICRRSLVSTSCRVNVPAAVSMVCLPVATRSGAAAHSFEEAVSRSQPPGQAPRSLLGATTATAVRLLDTGIRSRTRGIHSNTSPAVGVV